MSIVIRPLHNDVDSTGLSFKERPCKHRLAASLLFMATLARLRKGSAGRQVKQLIRNKVFAGAVLISALLLGSFTATGCSRGREMAAAAEYSSASQIPAQSGSTTVTERRRKGGIISTAGHLTGKILAFPFHVAAKTIEFIF